MVQLSGNPFSVGTYWKQYSIVVGHQYRLYLTWPKTNALSCRRGPHDDPTGTGFLNRSMASAATGIRKILNECAPTGTSVLSAGSGCSMRVLFSGPVGSPIWKDSL